MPGTSAITHVHAHNPYSLHTYRARHRVHHGRGVLIGHPHKTITPSRHETQRHGIHVHSRRGCSPRGSAHECTSHTAGRLTSPATLAGTRTRTQPCHKRHGSHDHTRCSNCPRSAHRWRHMPGSGIRTVVPKQGQGVPHRAPAPRVQPRCLCRRRPQQQEEGHHRHHRHSKQEETEAARAARGAHRGQARISAPHGHE